MSPQPKSPAETKLKSGKWRMDDLSSSPLLEDKLFKELAYRILLEIKDATVVIAKIAKAILHELLMQYFLPKNLSSERVIILFYIFVFLLIGALSHW
jgi:hypothetical protein